MAFIVTAVVIVSLMFGLAAAIAGAQEQAIDRLKQSAPAIKRWGGWILLAVGVWMAALAIFADFFAGIFTV